MRSVFDLPELYEHIARHLTPHDITQCVQICRLLQDLFGLFVYRGLTFRPSTKIPANIWSVTQWTGTTHVGTLGLTVDDTRPQIAKQ